MTKKATFTGKFGTPFYGEGHFTGIVKGVNKAPFQSKAGDNVWFVNLSIDEMPAHQVNNRWVENDNSVNQLAKFVTNLMNSLGVPYTAEEITSCDFEGLMNLFASKKLTNRKVSYRVEVNAGTTNPNATLQKVIFD